MRKFVLFFWVVAFCMSAKAQNDLEISWLPANATPVTSFGANSTGTYTFTVYMEFDLADLTNYKSLNITLDTIKQVQFHIDSTYLSSITACNVVIRQGDSIPAVTADTLVKSVPKGGLQKGWNYIDLDNPFVVKLTKKLYIGYRLSFSGEAYPFSVASDTNQKQGWITTGTTFGNLSTNGYGFLIKAVAASANMPHNEIEIVSLDIEEYNKLGDTLLIKGKINNVGSDPITSFKVSYELNGTQSSVETITGVSIAHNTSYDFIHSEKYPMDSLSLGMNLVVRVFEPNGVSDVELNNTAETKIKVYSSIVPRVVLHEVFTSSTCPPCKGGNERLQSVLAQVNDDTKWACIKYQYHFPGYGDPYFTAEGNTRAGFYGEISGVPNLFGNGNAYNDNPNGYTIDDFNRLTVPAKVAMTGGVVTITDKTITLQPVTIKAVVNMENPNLRFFAVIVEKKTVNNVKSNGETEFMYVMKKFMTSVNGDAVSSLKNNDSILLNNYSYTFKGDYRLPYFLVERDMIDHSKEHSVEDFNNLMVVYWLQDIVTKEVFQAGKTDPNPEYTPVSYNVAAFVNNTKMGLVYGGNQKYAANTTGYLLALPLDTNHHFVTWSDSVKTPLRQFTVTSDLSFTAIFEKNNNTDITEINSSSAINVYPNPATDKVTIILPENVYQANFILYDLQGKAIIQQNINNQDAVSVSNVASGIYIYSITTEKERHTGKLIRK